MNSNCATCGRTKKTIKSTNCHSCARKLQHKLGRFDSNKLDLSSGIKFCSYCNDNHEIVEGSSNEYWLMRRSKNRVRYECKKYRRDLYDRHRKDPKKRLRKSVSNLIRDCMVKHGAFKNDSFPKYVDWTVGELKQHLESQFVEGMSWDNYGEWHIDHIIPDSWFNYKSMNDDAFKRCWSLDNLQPMWARDNCSKGNRSLKKNSEGM